MKRRWLLPLLMLLASPAAAAVSDIGAFTRPVCTTITNPVANNTWCFDTTAGALKVWTGSAWVSVVGGQALAAYTLAGLPAAGTAGRLAWVTDTSPGFYFDTGTAWAPIVSSTGNLAFQSGTSFAGTFDHANTADRTYTLQDASDTLIGLATTDTLTHKTLLATGTGNVIAGVLDRDVTTTDVVSTTTETTVYSFSVPGGTLGTNRALRLTVIGDFLQNASDDIVVRVKYGGTVIGSLTTGAFPNSANRSALTVVCLLSAQNATNAQVAMTTITISGDDTATGLGGGQSSTGIGASVHNALAIDSTVDQTLLVSFQHDVVSASASARALAVHLEVLR